MTYEERKEQVRSYLGKTVTIKIDRPIGYIHHKEKYSLTYKINYGYIPDVIGGDGEELDVYLLGVDEPVDEYTCRIIGIVHRHNDIEDKLVAAPEGLIFNQAQIAQAVHFQEQYYNTKIEALYQKSCGAILFKREDGENKYLILFQKNSRSFSFPKGRMEMGESEEETAIREVREETGYDVCLINGFREEIKYNISEMKEKTLVLFLSEVFTSPNLQESEIEYFQWLNKEELRSILSKPYFAFIEKAERIIRGKI